MDEGKKSEIRFSDPDRGILANITKAIAKLDETVKILNESVKELAEKLPPKH